MKKHILKLTLIIGCSFLSLQSSVPAESNVGQDKAFTNLYFSKKTFENGLFDKDKNSLVPEDRIPESLIAWDLNGVFFDKEYSLKDNIAELRATHGILKTAKLLFTFAGLATYKEYLKLKKDPRGFVWDAVFSTLSEEDARILRYFAQKANHLNPAIADILVSLKDNGHKSVVLSNMGQNLADAQIDLLDKHIATLTDGTPKKDAAQTMLDVLTCPTNVIASEANGWLHKPDYASYQSCLNKNPAKTNPNRLRIFVDDKMRNIAAALADGQFDIAVKYENAENLRAILAALSCSAASTTKRTSLVTDTVTSVPQEA